MVLICPDFHRFAPPSDAGEAAAYGRSFGMEKKRVKILLVGERKIQESTHIMYTSYMRVRMTPKVGFNISFHPTKQAAN